MPTRPIPVGTVNFPINMTRELRSKVGQLAFKLDRATGAFIRGLIEVATGANPLPITNQERASFAAAKAETAAVHDEAADAILSRILSDDKITPCEMNCLKRAHGLIRTSATNDRELGAMFKTS